MLGVKTVHWALRLSDTFIIIPQSGNGKPNENCAQLSLGQVHVRASSDDLG